MVVFPIMNIRTKRALFVIVSLMSVAALLSMLMNYYLNVRNPLSGSQCSGVLEYHRNDSYTQMSVVFRFHDNQHADILLSGTTRDYNRVKLNLNRKVNYLYKYDSNGAVIMTDVNITRYASDDIGDNYFRRNVADFQQGTRLALRKFRNTYIIYNDHSPVLVCEISSLTE